MTGKIINQIENIITVEIDENYEFSENERVSIKIEKKTYLDELRGLFWVLLGWIIDNEKYLELPESDQVFFKQNENKKLLLEKLYTLIRWRVNFLEKSYRKDGIPIYIPKSTGNSITQKEFSELYEKAYEYFSEYIDMTEFIEQYQKTREKNGKYL